MDYAVCVQHDQCLEYLPDDRDRFGHRKGAVR